MKRKDKDNDLNGIGNGGEKVFNLSGLLEYQNSALACLLGHEKLKYSEIDYKLDRSEKVNDELNKLVIEMSSKCDALHNTIIAFNNRNEAYPNKQPLGLADKLSGIISKMPHTNYCLVSDVVEDAFKRVDNVITSLYEGISKVDTIKCAASISDEYNLKEKYSSELIIQKIQYSKLEKEFEELKEKLEDSEELVKTNQIKLASFGVMPYNVFHEISNKGTNFNIEHDCYCRVCGRNPSETSTKNKDEAINLQPSEKEFIEIVKRLQEENSKLKTKNDQFSLQLQESTNVKINEEMIINSNAFKHLLSEGESLAKQYTDLKQKLMETEERGKSDIASIINTKNQEIGILRQELADLRSSTLENIKANYQPPELMTTDIPQIKIEDIKYTDVLDAYENEKKKLSISLSNAQKENQELNNKLLQMRSQEENKKFTDITSQQRITKLESELNEEKLKSERYLKEVVSIAQTSDITTTKLKNAFITNKELNKNLVTMQKQVINNGKILKLHEEEQKEHLKMEESIKLLMEQISNQENAYKKHISAIENASTLQRIETGKYKELHEETLKRIDELEKKLKEREREIEKEKQTNKRQMEQNIKFQRENEQMKQKQHELPSIDSLPTDQKDTAMREIELSKYKSMVRCSMCSVKMKNVVLVKCMHSFCNDCINNCLANRNRKCPKCNHKFSQVDVKQLWLDD